MTMYNEGFFPAAKLNPIFFRSWTPDKPKMTLLYVHGSGGTSADCLPLAQALSDDEGIRVVAFDAPGNGHSQGNASISSFEAQRVVIQKLIENAKTPAAVLASSGGALATFMCLYLNRHKPKFSQIPVIFAEPSMGFDEITRRFIAQSDAFFLGRHASLDNARRVWDQTPLGKILFDNEDAKRAYIAGMLKVQGNALVSLTRAIDAKAIKDFNLLKKREALSNPSLVLWGENGGLKERYAEQLDSVLPNQTKIEFPGAGHPLALTRKVEIEAVAQFLRTHVGT
jgi:pimeloyl-ACP methyl ester carboxylesterase